MLYIIIAVLLIVSVLVIVIVQKKKNGKSSGKLPASGKRKSNKKNSSHYDYSEEEAFVSFEAPINVRTAAISEETRYEIEHLIRKKQFAAAEAQINQALHKNPTHQDLYLMLAEIHMHQDDEFALNQLIEHLRLSGLHRIVETVDAKKEVFRAQMQREHEQVKASSNLDNLNTSNFDQFDSFNTPSNNLSQFDSFNTPSNNLSQFDSFNTPSNNLSQFDSFNTPSNNLSQFDSFNTPSNNLSQFDSFNTPSNNLSQFDSFNTPSNNLSQFDSFSTPSNNLSQFDKISTTTDNTNFDLLEKPSNTTDSSMDFSFSEFNATLTTDTANSTEFNFAETTVSTPATNSVNSTDFDFAKPTISSSTAENSSMDFDFTVPDPAPKIEVVENLDFNFSEPTPVPVENLATNFNFDEPAPIAAETPAPGLDFNFSQIENSITPSAPEAFDFSSFNLDDKVQQPTPNEPIVDVSEFLTASDSLNTFASEELDYSNLNTNNMLTTANVPSHTIQNLDVMESVVPTFSESSSFVAEETVEATELTNGNDPLLQAFPTLASYRPVEVHLNLAEQYIKLGAYDAAEALLKNRNDFNAEQNRSADMLLQRLAS